MKRWSSALFPLGLLLVLTGLTYWLRLATELPPEKRDGKSRHDPDYVVSGAKLRKLDSTGRLQYAIKAEQVVHYPDDDTTDLTRPALRYLYATRPSVTVSAQRGHATAGGERIDLYDDVRVHREASKKDEAMTGYSSALTVFPDDEKAFTKQAVLITQGRSRVKGVGLQLDNKAQTYLLESRARAVIESRYARKKHLP